MRRYAAFMLALFILCGLCHGAQAAAPAPYELSGRPKVVDGDTLKFGRHRVRLLCIDAPESGQPPFGAKATAALRNLIGDDTVTCTGRFFDVYDRLLAYCSTKGRDLNMALAAEGLAVPGGGQRCGAYAQAAHDALTKKRGIWSDSGFITPREWRRHHPL